MKKKLSLSLWCLAIAFHAMAQASFVSDDRVAVFYPAAYDASQHSPSPIFVKEPCLPVGSCAPSFLLATA